MRGRIWSSHLTSWPRSRIWRMEAVHPVPCCFEVGGRRTSRQRKPDAGGGGGVGPQRLGKDHRVRVRLRHINSEHGKTHRLDPDSTTEPTAIHLFRSEPSLREAARSFVQRLPTSWWALTVAGAISTMKEFGARSAAMRFTVMTKPGSPSWPSGVHGTPLDFAQRSVAGDPSPSCASHRLPVWLGSVGMACVHARPSSTGSGEREGASSLWVYP